jgi:hypothetical protein
MTFFKLKQTFKSELFKLPTKHQKVVLKWYFFMGLKCLKLKGVLATSLKKRNGSLHYPKCCQAANGIGQYFP